MVFNMLTLFFFSLLSLHFTAATHNGVTNYHATQGNQTLPTSEADFVSDLSQGKWTFVDELSLTKLYHLSVA